MMSARLRIAAVMLAASVVHGACSSAFDRSFDAGRYDEAIQHFAADSTLRNEPGALYRAALAYATPDHPAYDPERARELLRDLLDRFPGSGEHRHAVALFSLLETSGRLEREGERVQAELQALRQQVATLEQRIAQQEALHADVASSNVALRDSLERAQRVLRVREAQMRALQDELRALKRIDLRPVSADTSGN
jgi:tetratricopeptide (TPR) repeat protein